MSGCKASHTHELIFDLDAGLVGLEILKLVQEKVMEAYRNTFANLALPLYAIAEPMPPTKMRYKEMEWSLWDRWILEGDLTVRQVLEWFKVSLHLGLLPFLNLGHTWPPLATLAYS